MRIVSLCPSLTELVFDLDRADDVYRGENARAADWIMVGNHDTPPIWQLVESWQRDGGADARARDLVRGPFQDSLRPRLCLRARPRAGRSRRGSWPRDPEGV